MSANRAIFMAKITSLTTCVLLQVCKYASVHVRECARARECACVSVCTCTRMSVHVHACACT